MQAKHLEAGATRNSDIVEWTSPLDSDRPCNWSAMRKWSIVVTTTLMTFMVSFGSSVFSAIIKDTMDEFHVSSKVTTLGISLYVLGFASGPLIFGPASELYGRTIPLWLGYVGFLIFQAPLAVAKDIQTVLIVRFFAGVFGSAPLAITGGMYVDFLDPVGRGIATAVYSVGVYCGPVTGPIIGNLMIRQLSWRWTAWITLVGGSFFFALAVMCTPETSEAVLLRRKAQKLRFETSDWALHARSEETPTSIRYFVEKYLTKPIRMFVAEPILVIFTIYMSLVYGILYLSLTLYPFAFHTKRGWAPLAASMPFLWVLVGIVLACVIIGVHSVWHGKRLQAGAVMAPEDRLPPVIMGAILLPAGLFLFAATSDTNISWIPQVMSGALIGCGIVLVFMCSNLYVIEVYLYDANSALAINVFLRSIVAAAFPVLSTAMFSSLGVKWSGIMLGLLCVVLAPFPIVLMRYGSRVRAWSKFAR